MSSEALSIAQRVTVHGSRIHILMKRGDGEDVVNIILVHGVMSASLLEILYRLEKLDVITKSLVINESVNHIAYIFIATYS